MFSVALSVTSKLTEAPQPLASERLGILPCGVWTFLPDFYRSGYPPFQTKSQTTYYSGTQYRIRPQ
jgi:hypothetical protein